MRLYLGMRHCPFLPISSRSHKVVILVVATTGEGDATDNAKKFNRFVTSKATPSEILRGLKYTVFGLGDLNYINFNQMGKRTEINMDRLGAVKIHPRGVGDASQDIEADLRKWIDLGLFDAVREHVPNMSRTGSKPVVVLNTGLPDLMEMVELEHKPAIPDFSAKGSGTLSKVFWELVEGKLIHREELRQVSSDTLSTKEITVQLPASATYTPGDTVEILPENPSELVSEVAKYFNAEDSLDNLIDFKCSGERRLPFPTPCTLRTALTQYMDLACSPSRTLVSNLAVLNRDNSEMGEALFALSSNPPLMKEVGLAHISTLEFLRIFESAFGTRIKLSLSEFLQIGPKQRVRAYTGASAGHSNVKLVFSYTFATRSSLRHLVEQLVPRGILPSSSLVPTQDRFTYRGICSQYLSSVSLGHRILLRVRESILRPTRPTQALLAICTGAGIAPFMAYIDVFEKTGEWPKTIFLVFGFRNPAQDQLYKDHIARLEAQGRVRVFRALSQEPNVKKTYVQDIVREDRDIHQFLQECMTNDRRIIVCGNTAMGRSVCETIASQIGGQAQLELLEQRRILTVEYFG